MHAKPSFAHRLQAAKMPSSRTSVQENGPRAQNNGLWGPLFCGGEGVFYQSAKCFARGLCDFNRVTASC